MSRASIFQIVRAKVGRVTPDMVISGDAWLDSIGFPRDEEPAGAPSPAPRQPTSLKAPDAFYGALRGSLFKTLAQSQVDGTNAILAACGAASWPIAYTAYALATTYHETAFTMQPIKEHGGTAYFHRMYDPQGQRPHVAKALGNTQPGDGARFAGRGYVQLTGRANYRKASQKLGVDLIGNPDLAMDPKIAADVMVFGMAEGWFTSRKMADYLPTSGAATRAQFREARRIINGLDRADKIAGEALAFQDALARGGWG